MAVVVGTERTMNYSVSVGCNLIFASAAACTARRLAHHRAEAREHSTTTTGEVLRNS